MERTNELEHRPHRAWRPSSIALVLGGLLVPSGGAWSTLVSMPAQEEARLEHPRGLAIGARVRPFRFVDSRFLPRTLDELGPASAYVITFTTIDCPLAKRYLPRLGDLEREFLGRGARFLVLDVGPDDSLVDAIGQALEAGIDYPLGRDYEGQAVAALAPTRTPETVVLDADLRLRYRGRVDDQYRFGGVRPTVERQDLRIALEEVLAGKEVTLPETPVDGCLITPPARTPSRAVTFAADVLPILRKSCQPCHGQPHEAPFALVTYDDALRHSAMIAEVVEQRRMPPWFADSRYGAWSNDRRLSSAEIGTIRDWVLGGAPRGDPEASPAEEERPTPSASQGAAPGLTLHAGKFAIPADGLVPYETVPLRDAAGEIYEFPRDTWVARSAVVPSSPAVLHHARVMFEGVDSGPRVFGGYVPGAKAIELGPGIAFKIPAGTRLLVTLHQVTTGLPVSNEITVQYSFPTELVTKQLHSMDLGLGRFEIPPGARAFELVARERMPRRARGIALYGHMHLRGRDMLFERLARTGAVDTAETMLFIPNYSFDWQLIYYWQRDRAPLIEPGSVIQCTAHYDNSAFNAYNPDPTSTVRRGEQTEDEMMLGMLMYVDEDEHLELEIDPATGWVVGSTAPDAQQEGSTGTTGRR